MLNLLRMNFYRAIHDKGLWIICILVVSFAALSSYAFVMDTDSIKNESYQEDKKEAVTHENGVGIIVSTPISEDNAYADYILYYSEEICSGIFVLFGTIAVVIFFQSEEKDGFIKNIAGQIKYRFNIYFSKFIVMGIFIFTVMLCCIPIQFLILKIYSGGDINFGIDYLPEFFCAFSIQYLLCLAFLSGIALVTVVTRSTVAGIVIGLLAIMGVGNMLVVQILKILHIDADIYKYLITSNIYSVKISMEDKLAVTAVIVGFVFLIVYNIAGSLILSKRDIV